MAISPATLTITTTENLKLNGVTYGNTIVKSLTSCGEVTQRILSAATTPGSPLLDLDTTTKQDNFVHFRVKNTDTSNFITLHLGGAVTGTHKVKLLAGESYEITCNEIWDYTAAAWDKIRRITVIADSTACDVEMFYVSK